LISRFLAGWVKFGLIRCNQCENTNHKNRPSIPAWAI
jgi:hypothetical protein